MVEGYLKPVGQSDDIKPFMLDASVFATFGHCKAVLSSRGSFYVSRALYDMLFEAYDRQAIFETLRYFSRRRLEFLPSQKFDLRDRLQPYRYKEKYVEDILPYLRKEKSRLQNEAKTVILDQFSFLKEHSSILMATRRFVNYLHQAGILLVDAANKVYDLKSGVFQEIRGGRWLVALLLEATAVVDLLRKQSNMALVFGLGGFLVLLLDP